MNKQFLFKTEKEALQFYEEKIIINQTKLIYFKTVKRYLEALIKDKDVVISEITKPENIQFFLQCISIFIVVYSATYPDFTIVFSDDYKSFKKQ